MNRWKRVVTIAFAISVLVTVVAVGQESPTVTIATNPMKYFAGLPNIDVEVLFADTVGVHVAAEYLFGEIEEHPRAVIRLGARYYPLAGAEVLPGTFTTLDLAWLGRDEPGASELAIAGELGYRFTWGWFSLLPRGILSYGFASGDLLPGIEALVGWTTPSQ
ncbi:MAG: hypothetical protein ACLFNT_12110 [Spirochaetales bacterium]